LTENNQTDKAAAAENNSSTEIQNTVVSHSSTFDPDATMKKEGGGMEKECSCKAGGMANKDPNYVYALGSIRVSFPTPTIEKEYRQVVREEQTERLTDPQVLYNVLKNNRYITREVCWILTIEGIDTYIIVPRDPLDLDQLVESIAQEDRERLDTDVVIGERGPIAPIEYCGVELPVLMFDKIYSFKKKGLIDEIPKPTGVEEKQFRISSDDVFDRIQQLADNVGSTDEHRALNYLAVRYPQLYVHTNQMHANNFSLESVEAMASRLSGSHKLIDVIITYQNRDTTAIEKYYVRVDVTGKYPFLASPLQRYFDRV
jgi:PatG C-terminal